MNTRDTPRQPSQSAIGSNRDPELIARWLITALGASVLLFAMAALLLASNKGLDITDEGLYLLTARHPGEYIANFTKAQLIWSPILSAVGSVTGLRIVKLLLLIAAGALLGFSIAAEASDHKRPEGGTGRTPARCVAVISVTLAALAPATWLPQSPGYNDLAVIASITACAMVLRVRRSTSPRAITLNSAALIVALWVLLLAKWPAAIALGTLSAVTLAPTVQRMERASRKCFAWAATGSLLACTAATHLLLEPLGDVVGGLREATSNLGGSHDLSSLREEYVGDISDLVDLLISRWWVLCIAVLTGWLIARKTTERVGTLSLCIVMGLCLWMDWTRGALSGGAMYSIAFGQYLPFMLVVASTVAAGTMLSASRPLARWRIAGWPAVLFLCAAPFAGALGSNNSIWTSAGSYSALWVAALVLVVGSLGVHEAVAELIAVAVAGSVALAAVFGTWLSPYRQPPLSEVHTEITQGPARGLVVADSTMESIRRVQSLTRPGDSLVIVWKSAGLVFATDTVQPRHAWLSKDFPLRAVESLEEACRRDAPVTVINTTPELPGSIRRATRMGSCAGREFSEATSITLADGSEMHSVSAPGRPGN